ncbi:MAG: hypothetical protein ACO4CU_12670 [Ilumatobacteraceae bacterium]
MTRLFTEGLPGSGFVGNWFVVCSRRIALKSTLRTMLCSTSVLLRPFTLQKMPRIASIVAVGNAGSVAPASASEVLSPSIVNPRTLTPEVDTVTMLPLTGSDDGGTMIASATRSPPFGDTFQFGPRTSSAFEIVMNSA